MRYLGLTIDENLSWIPHIEGLRSKMITLYKDLSAFKSRSFGLPQGLIRVWYLVVGEKRLSYAAPCWAHNLNAHAIRKLRSAQRTALLYIVGAYRRTSTDALNILAGVPPIELTLERDYNYHRVVRLGRDVRIKDDFFKPGEVEQVGRSTRIDPRKKLPYSFNQEKGHVQVNIFTDGSKMKDSTALAYCVERDGEFIYEIKHFSALPIRCFRLNC